MSEEDEEEDEAEAEAEATSSAAAVIETVDAVLIFEPYRSVSRRPTPHRGLRPPRNFGWPWRAIQQATGQQQTQTTPTPTPRRRRYNVCDVVTGRRIPDKQHVLANQHPPEVTAIRVVHVDPRIVVRPVPDTTEPVNVIMAAGILFFSQRNDQVDGETLFLLGREQYYPHWQDSDKWADFGGGVDVVDEDVAGTAAREAWEESMGVIHTYETLLARLHSNEASAVFDVQVSDNAGCYRIYLLKVPYFDYNMMLSRFRAYLRRHKIQILDAEKTLLDWVESRHLVRISEPEPEPEVGSSSSSTLVYSSLRPNFAKSIVEISKRIDLHSLYRVVSSAEGTSDAGPAGPSSENTLSPMPD